MKSWTKRNLICVMLTMVMVFSTLFGNFVYTRYCKAKDYTDAGSVQWVKDRAFSVLGITLPATGMNEFGLYGGNNYWNILKYEKGSEPEKNALAVWKYNDAGAESVEGKYGRVAFVEDVSDDIVTVTTGGCEGETFEENTGVIKRSVSKAEMQTLGGCSGFYGYIYLEKPIRITNLCKINLSGASDLKVSDLICDRIDTHSSGSSDMNLKGKANDGKYSCSGSSDIKAYDFVIKRLKCSASGSSDIFTTVTEKLEANASGSSDIKYKGNPEVKKHSSGSSDIDHIK